MICKKCGYEINRNVDFLTNKCGWKVIEKKLYCFVCVHIMKLEAKMIDQVMMEKVRNLALAPMDVHRYNDDPAVEVYNICTFIDHIDPTYSVPYEEMTKYLMEWCKINKCSYYAAPREDFSYYHAMKLANSEGNTKVMVEDLS